VERYIEDPLADELLKGTFDDAKGVRVEFDQQKLFFFPA
jgi:ATP-dependent Clp protease ATP-binding subunit ClpC